MEDPYRIVAKFCRITMFSKSCTIELYLLVGFGTVDEHRDEVHMMS